MLSMSINKETPEQTEEQECSEKRKVFFSLSALISKFQGKSDQAEAELKKFRLDSTTTGLYGAADKKEWEKLFIKFDVLKTTLKILQKIEKQWYKLV